MENSTPLRTVKKKISKLLLFGNILMMVFVVGLTGYYLRSRLLETQSSKACSGGSDQSGYCQGQIGRKANEDAVSEGGSTNSCTPGTVGCKAPGVGGIDNWHYSNCANGASDAYCTGATTGGGEDQTTTTITNPTNTPIPTSTTVPTSTPANTPTPTPTVPAGSSPIPTGTLAPTATGTPGPTATPIPVLCGTKSCDNATNPCRSGYNCIQANDGSNYCSSPDFVTACKANPSYNACCIAPGAPTATPTEIILAKISTSPTSVAKLLETGVVKSFMYLIPAIIILVGLIL